MSDSYREGDIVVVTKCENGHGFEIGQKVRIYVVNHIKEGCLLAEDLDGKDKWALHVDEVSRQV